MTSPTPTQPPVLSTPDTHIFEDPTPARKIQRVKRTKEEIWSIYEVERTARRIWEGGYSKVALQFPDHMLGDGVGVFEGLEECLRKLEREGVWRKEDANRKEKGLEEDLTAVSVSSPMNGADTSTKGTRENRGKGTKLYILADTSYGSCCIDEIAASHVSADCVVHYGRACLSPTARLPVIYVFTTQPLDHSAVVSAFENTFPERGEKAVLMAGLEWHSHIQGLIEDLRERGYTNVYAPEVVRDPGGVIPNRKVDSTTAGELGEWSLWHLGQPPKALLLTLSSRVKELYIYPTEATTAATTLAETLKRSTQVALRRRYALLSTLPSAPIIGILINTLSVADTLPALKSLQSLISRAGKKYYTFVVGKVNAAKMANFSEVGAWVVVGCWESSLLENEGEAGSGWWKAVVTPWEAGVALSGGMGKGKEGWEWDGRWRGDFGGLGELELGAEGGDGDGEEDDDEEEESAPPEFDLRTGKYVQHSRPMRTSTNTTKSPSQNLSSSEGPTQASNVLTRRAKGDLATVNGAVSPGAEYLRSQRTWTGLGSDFETAEEEEGDVRIHGNGIGASVEEGRSGVARGYRVGENGERT